VLQKGHRQEIENKLVARILGEHNGERMALCNRRRKARPCHVPAVEGTRCFRRHSANRSRLDEWKPASGIKGLFPRDLRWTYARRNEMAFNRYHKWLGIFPKIKRPTYYQLFGIDFNEEDIEVIQSAAEKQRSHAQQFEQGT